MGEVVRACGQQRPIHCGPVGQTDIEGPGDREKWCAGVVLQRVLEIIRPAHERHVARSLEVCLANHASSAV